MSAPIVFLDTETTSLGPKREPWEIAMIKRDSDGQQDSISFFVNWPDLSKADPMSLKFSRFYERHPQFNGSSDFHYIMNADGRTSLPPPYVVDRDDAARLVHSWTRGAHIVGAVPNFDIDMLDRVLRESRLVPDWHYHLIDVENLAVGWLAAREGFGDPRQDLDPPWKSDDLSLACGVEPPSDEERHTALGDARWAMRWYDKIMGIDQ